MLNTITYLVENGYATPATHYENTSTQVIFEKDFGEYIVIVGFLGPLEKPIKTCIIVCLKPMRSLTVSYLVDEQYDHAAFEKLVKEEIVPSLQKWTLT